MYKRIGFDNGLRVVLHHMPGRDSAAVGVWIAAGSRCEDKRLSGISHFLEHMVFKGTPTRNNRKIKEEIEGKGGSLNGFTSEEITCYLAKVSHAHLDVAIDVLSDMALNAAVNRDDIERERAVIIEEIKMYRDLPNHHIHDILSEIMWPKHSLGFSVAGDIASVRAITRQNLIDYRNEKYIPKNMVVVICGNLRKRTVLKRIDRIFRIATKKKPSTFSRFKNTQTHPRVRILHKPTEQTRLSMGLHTFGRMHRDRYALALLHIILGANMSSRLFENIREKRGLAYEIGTDIKRYKDTGAFIINAGIEHGKVKKATGLIINELAIIKEKRVPEDELNRAKEFFGVQLSLALEDTMDHMLWLGEQVTMTDRVISKKNVIREVNSVSSRDIQRVARNIFKPSNLSLAVIGPLKDTERKKIEKESRNL